MRIVTARLNYIHGDEAVKDRRDRLGSVGIDVTAVDNEALAHCPQLGMTDAQFVQLNIEGERDMVVVASTTTED
jgi:hypothetical protein